MAVGVLLSLLPELRVPGNCSSFPPCAVSSAKENFCCSPPVLPGTVVKKRVHLFGSLISAADVCADVCVGPG